MGGPTTTNYDSLTALALRARWDRLGLAAKGPALCQVISQKRGAGGGARGLGRDTILTPEDVAVASKAEYAVMAVDWRALVSSLVPGEHSIFDQQERRIVKRRIQAMTKAAAVDAVAATGSGPMGFEASSAWVPNCVVMCTDLAQLVVAVRGGNGGSSCDVVLRTSDGGEVRAHRVVLSARCMKFHALFHFAEASNAAPPTSEAGRVVEVDNISSDALGLMVHYLYTGELSESLGGWLARFPWLLCRLPLLTCGVATAVLAVSTHTTPAGLFHHVDDAVNLLMELIYFADEYMLPELRALACGALVEEYGVTASTCIECLQLCGLFRLPELQEVACNFIMGHFREVCEDRYARESLEHAGIGIKELLMSVMVGGDGGGGSESESAAGSGSRGSI